MKLADRKVIEVTGIKYSSKDKMSALVKCFGGYANPTPIFYALDPGRVKKRYFLSYSLSKYDDGWRAKSIF